MVSWKVVLVVVIIAALAIAIGMWFGYRYASEQEDISPNGWREPSNTINASFAESLVLAPVLTEVWQKQYWFLYANLYLFQKGESKL